MVQKMAEITKKQCKDTGLAMILLSLILYFFFQDYRLLISAFIFTLLSMTFLTLLKPLAFLWFGLTKILGEIMSRIVLSLVFLAVVTPVGLFRRLLRKDRLNLRKFRKSTASVFVARQKTFDKADLETPF